MARRRSRFPLAAPLVVVAVIAAALIAFLVRGGDDSDPAPSSTSTSTPSLTVPPPAPTTVAPSTTVDGTVTTDPGPPPSTVPLEGTRSVLLLLDGWSARVLDGAPMWVDAGAAGRQDLRFAPFDADTVDVLRRNHPTVLGTVVARLATVGPLAGCDADTCRDGTGAPVTSAQLADPSTLPSLGPVYADWQVTAGVWAAEVTVPADAPTVTVHTSRNGWAPTTVVVTTFDEGDAAPVPVPVVAVGAGLGRLFPITPAFVGESPSTGPMVLVPGSAALTAGAPVPFVAGLGAVDPAAAGLDPAWLTYLTSPSTGCGAGVLCVPDGSTTTVTVEVLARETRSWCATGDRDDRIEVDYVDARWAVVYPHQTHQGGAWFGVTPDPVGGDSMLFSGTPGLVSADQVLRVSTARVAGPSGGSQWVRGQVLHVGFDAQASVDTPTTTVFDRLLLVPDGYTACRG